MAQYLDSIEQAAYIFPFAIAIIAIPYFVYQYKHYGRIEVSKSLVTFTFLLYIICCYCLVILPLPSYEEVMAMQGPYTDFRFLGFVNDFINRSEVTLNPTTWLPALRSPWFYMPFFNFVMLIPFGIYQKRLFKKSFFQTFFLALLLSLSFELIQLSGLFGIYPHPYRLFQLDDIMLNTLGALVGWFITPKANSTNPQKIMKSRFSPPLKGRVITFILDLILLSFIMHIYSVVFTSNAISANTLTQYGHYLIVGTLYYIVISWFLEQRTPASYLFDYSYQRVNGSKVKLPAFILRQVCFFAIVLPLPVLALYLFSLDITPIITIPGGIFCLLIPLVVIIQTTLDLPPFYESISGVFLTDNRKKKRINKRHMN